MAEKFEYDEIKSKLILIKQYCTDYVKAVSKIETTLQTELNVSINSALFGVQGQHVVSLWNDYCSKLPNFLYVFEKWMDSVSNVYNNNMLFEAGNDKLKLEVDGSVNLAISDQMLSDEEKEKLASLYSGNISSQDTVNDGNIETITIGGVVYQIIRDNNGNIISIINTSTNQETEIYLSSYEEYIDSIYQRYLDGEMSEEEWNQFKNSLNDEQRQYAIYLETGAIVDNLNNVNSILYGNGVNNMAEEIAQRNTPPSDGFVDDEVLSRASRFADMQEWYQGWFSNMPRCYYDSKLGLWVYDMNQTSDYFNRLYLNWNNDYQEESNIYIDRTVIPNEDGLVTSVDGVSSNNKVIYTLYVDGEEVATYESSLGSGLSYNEMRDMFDQAFPNVYQTTYSKQGEEAYNAFSSNINANYEEFNQTGIFYFNNDRSIYYDSSSGQIHYPDGSVLDVYSTNLAWIRFWFINIKDRSRIKDLFMVANGYIEYTLLDR